MSGRRAVASLNPTNCHHLDLVSLSLFPFPLPHPAFVMVVYGGGQSDLAPMAFRLSLLTRSPVVSVCAKKTKVSVLPPSSLELRAACSSADLSLRLVYLPLAPRL